MSVPHPQIQHSVSAVPASFFNNQQNLSFNSANSLCSAPSSNYIQLLALRFIFSVLCINLQQPLTTFGSFPVRSAPSVAIAPARIFSVSKPNISTTSSSASTSQIPSILAASNPLVIINYQQIPCSGHSQWSGTWFQLFPTSSTYFARAPMANKCRGPQAMAHGLQLSLCRPFHGPPYQRSAWRAPMPKTQRDFTCQSPRVELQTNAMAALLVEDRPRLSLSRIRDMIFFYIFL